MPNCAEALTPEMVEYLFDQDQISHQDSAIAAYADWAVLSLQSGFRISEYAQSHSAMYMCVFKSHPLRAYLARDIFTAIYTY